MALKEHDKLGKEELEKLIDNAIKKVRGDKENDLCKFIPGPAGGYVHHFTFRKWKNSDPAHLFKLLQKFIVEMDTPKALDPKPRAPRGSRNRPNFFSFTRTDIERVLEVAKQVGDKDLLARFSPKRSFPVLKKELIRSIRENKVNHDLWNAYAELMAAHELADSATH